MTQTAQHRSAGQGRLPTEDQSVGELLAGITERAERLVKAEIALAKAELKNDVKRAGLGAGMFGAAGFTGIFALAFLSTAAAWGIAWLLGVIFGRPVGVGWGFLVVGVVYLIVAAITALMGKASLAKMTKVERTKKTLQDDAAWAKQLPKIIKGGGEPDGSGAAQLEAGTGGRPAVGR